MLNREIGTKAALQWEDVRIGSKKKQPTKKVRNEMQQLRTLTHAYGKKAFAEHSYDYFQDFWE